MDTTIIRIDWIKTKKMGATPYEIKPKLKPTVDFEYMWNHIVTPQILIELERRYEREGKAAKFIEVEMTSEGYGILKRIIEDYSPLELKQIME